MCPHGAAKSVLASAYFERLAKERGLKVLVRSAGTEPDATIAPAVAAHLQRQGYATSTTPPRKATADDLAQADLVISLGCDLSGLPTPRGTLMRWDDVPAPSVDFAKADDAIRSKVEALVDELVRQAASTGRAAPAAAPALPPDYQAVLATLKRPGDFRDGVLKVNLPRADLKVTIGGRPAPTPFGFGGWIAMTKASGGHDVLMGDLVLTEDEVNPVMSALLTNGLDVTALHNHFFWEQPRIFYLHVHGTGPAADLTARIKPALDLIPAAGPPAGPAPAAAPTMDTAALAATIGHQGEQTGPVYKITIGRADLAVREHGALINARMGLNTWAAFAGTDADAMVAGDVAMLEAEVTPVLRSLRASGVNVVAIHHHMTGVTPAVVFLHYYGTGPAARLAQAVRAAVDLLGTK
jgi:protein-tyrosine-phosphatase